MIGCDDGGAWVSFNAGDSWSTIYNQLTAQFYHVATDDQYPYLVYGSQQDNSSIAVPSRTNKGAINWADCYPPGTAESGYVAPKPDDPNIVYVGAIGSSPGGGDALQRYDHRTKQIQLVSVWPEAYHDGNTAEVRFQWTYPIVFSPHDPNVLYAAGNKVFRSTDEGHSWEAISPDLTYADPDTMGVSGPLTMDTAGAEMYATIFSLMVSAPRAGRADGRLRRRPGARHHATTAATWTDVTPARPAEVLAGHDDRGVAAHRRHGVHDRRPPQDGRLRAVRVQDHRPRRDVDADRRRHPRERLLPGDPRGPEPPGPAVRRHRAGASACRSTTAPTGSRCSATCRSRPVYDFVVKDTDLVVATHGRSFWILDDLTQLHQIHDDRRRRTISYLFTPRDTVRTPPDLFADFWGSPGGKNYHVTIGQNATFYLDEDETGHKAQAGDRRRRRPRPRRRDHVPVCDDDADGEATLTIVDADGNEIETFSSDIPDDKKDRDGLYITAKPGMNSFQWSMNHRAWREDGRHRLPRSAAGPARACRAPTRRR